MSEKNSGKKGTDTDTDIGQSDAITLLQTDHRTVERLFKQYEDAGTSEEKMQIAKQVCTELIVHSRLEEEIFYPSCRENKVEASVLDEAQVEHDGVKLLIGEILQQQPDSPYYDAKVSVLSEYVKHHVGEEEKSSDGIFAKARAAKLDMNALGKRLLARKKELMEQREDFGSTSIELPSLELCFIHSNRQEISTMPRQYEQERDEHGRFTHDDDNYHSGGRSRYQSSGRDRDDHGRFVGDDDGKSGRHYSSQGSHRGDEDDRWSSGRSSGRARDEQGRYTNDDDGRGDDYRHSQSYDRERDEHGRFVGDNSGYQQHSGRSYRDDDYGYRSSSRGSSGRERDEHGRFMSDADDRNMRGSSGRRGHGGWFGDSEGHARAAEERYQGRGSSYSSRGEDDYDSGSRGSSGGRGHGGWFGDHEGHARAAEEGWRHRESSGSSRRYDEDDQGRSRSGGDDRGWYGDAQGHAEAARRGWQNRR
ncbi:MAG: hemerythrin domain-containing protein [Rhizobium sp.]|nr:hemerythrin domain-containing protein [Rhizobium sp.]